MKKLLSTLAFSTALAAAASAQATISEIRVDQSGTDNDEFFELVGDPGTSLDGLHYITIGDGAGGSGTVEAVVDLTGQVIPASGAFVCAEGTFTLGTADLVADVNFENSDNVTHLLVTGFTGASGDDIDADDDGVIDNVLWTAVIDEVAFMETDPVTVGGDLLYSDKLIGPDGTFAVAGAQRNINNGIDAWTLLPFGDLSLHTPGVVNGNPGIFAAIGGAQHLFLDAGAANAGNFYVFATTTTGTSPGIPVFGLTVPLNASPILDYSVTYANGPVFQHTLGFLDGNGQTWATLQLPALDPALAGVTAHTAAIVLDPFTLAGTAIGGPVALDVL